MHKNTVFLVLLFASAVLVLFVYGAKLYVDSRPPERDELVTTAPIVGPADPVIGPQDAAVTIIEFGDFQCVFCQASRDVLARIRTDYPDDVRIVWKDFPDVDGHAQALPAARAARCAQDQGKFWEYHDLLFVNQTLLSDTLYAQIASELKLNTDTFQQCMQRPVPSVVSANIQAGIDRGVSSIPHFFFNDIQQNGSIEYTEASMIIEQLLNESQ